MPKILSGATGQYSRGCRDYVDSQHSSTAVAKKPSAKHTAKRAFCNAAAAGLIAVITAATTVYADPPEMAIPGQSNVSSTGAFTYTIPIHVPPGTAGMVPVLSLDYSSENSDGQEGFGWVLSGLSVITRCPRTLAQDGIHGGVNYDSSVPTTDRFCLNGQRLIVVTGNYGANNAQYRTEINSFSKIVSYTQTGVPGIAYFRVWTKAGQILEFGNTTDSRAPLVSVPGSPTGAAGTVRAWGVSKISDTKGNYLKVIYGNGNPDTAHGELYPTEISYTWNDGSSPALAAHSSVQFFYISRNTGAIVPAYQAGAVIKPTVLLSEIKTCTSDSACVTGNLVSDYKLTYDGNNANLVQTGDLHDELSSVQLCDGSGNCLPATTFGWQGYRGTLSYTTTDMGNVLVAGTQDVNGDGLGDKVLMQGLDGCPSGTNQDCFAYGKQDGTFATPAPWGPNCHYSDSIPSTVSAPVEINGDGYPDFLFTWTVFSTYSNYLCKNNQDGTVTQIGGSYHMATPPNDYNGDGLMDYYSALDSAYNVANTFYFGDGAGNFPQQLPGPNVPNGSGPYTYGDFDGDGCTDILFQGAPYSSLYYTCNPAQTTFAVPNWQGQGDAPSLYQGIAADFNGDGKADLLSLISNGVVDGHPQELKACGTATLYLSTGTGLVDSGFSVPSVWCHYQVLIGDWNGDGKTDIALIANGSDENVGRLRPADSSDFIWLSTGHGFVQKVVVPNNSADFTASVMLSDYNNDGVTDLLNDQGTQAGFDVTRYLFTYSPELITSVTTGTGATTSITYDRLNENAPFYTKCTNNSSTYACGDTYPTQAVDKALYVVSEIDSSNGLGACAPPNLANCYSTSYAYAGAKTDVNGRGFLGFQQIAATDGQTHLVQTTTYLTAYPFTGQVASETKVCPKGYCLSTTDVTLSSTTNCFTTDCSNTPPAPTNGIYTVELMKTMRADADTDGTALPTVTISYLNTNGTPAYDSYGNPTRIVQSVSDGSSKVTTNTYSNDAADWLLGHLTDVTVASTVPGHPAITRESSFCFDLPSSSCRDPNAPTPSGLLMSETIQPSDSSSACLYLKTSYQYDVFGNRISAVAQGINSTCGSARTSTQTFANDGTATFGQFATSNQDAFEYLNGFSEVTDYTTGSNSGRAFGVPLKHTDANNLVTQWTYDGFGRMTLEKKPDRTQTVATYIACPGQVCGGLPADETAPANAQFYVMATPQASNGTTQNGPITITFYDSLSRVIASDIEAFDGSASGCSAASPCWSRTDTVYDALGRLSNTSRPHFLGDTARRTVYSYINPTNQLNDPLGRPQTVTPPGANGANTFSYSGLTTTVTNADNETTVTTKNAQGLVALVTDALDPGDPGNHTMRYDYDSEGDLLTVTDPKGNKIKNCANLTTCYDIRGRKVESLDADMGDWTYGYDAFGELTSQTDNNGQLTTIAYDVLGRPTHKVEAGSVTSNWIYGTDPTQYNVEQLVTSCRRGTSSSTCSNLSSSSFLRTRTYDTGAGLARIKTETLTIDNTANVFTLGYNSDGRLASMQRPSGLQLDYAYSGLGYLEQLKDHASGTAFWTANARDAEMHLTNSTAGNGVQTTQNFSAMMGWLTQTTAGQANGIADFSYGYDHIGNLTSRTDMLAGSGGITEMACYDNLNRLTKYSLEGSTCGNGSDKKTLTYDALGNITKKSDVSVAGGYLYGGASPHQVTSITSCTGSGCFPVAGVSNPSFRYDPNGNLVCVLGTGQSCDSTAAEYVTWTPFNMVSVVTEGGGAVSSTFSYDEQHARIKQVVSASGTTSTTTYLNEADQIEEKFVVGPTPLWRDYVLADGHIVAEQIRNGSSVTNTNYFVDDNLGSPSVVIDDHGAVIMRLSYDAWGKRRNATDWSDDSTCGLTGGAVTRGYTGHEEMEAECLVNMNARIYDPTLGRFMSADSIVPDPLNGQSYNRYAYVNDNPLSLTDPSGDQDVQPLSVPAPETVVVTAPAIHFNVYGNLNSLLPTTGATLFIRAGGISLNGGRVIPISAATISQQNGIYKIHIRCSTSVCGNISDNDNTISQLDIFAEDSVAYDYASGSTTPVSSEELLTQIASKNGLGGPRQLPLPNRKWAVWYQPSLLFKRDEYDSQIGMKHTYDTPDPTAGRYFEWNSDDDSMADTAATTIDKGTIVGRGKAPNTIMMKYTFPTPIGLTGDYNGSGHLLASTNVVILEYFPGSGGKLYMVVTQYPALP